ncbi:MAG: hypothetical protein AAFZ07_07760 [Actinomycetota bacterium]
MDAFAERARRSGEQAATHPTGSSQAAGAQGASKPPPNDVASQAAAAQVGDMDRTKPAPFDKAAFMAAVRAQVRQAAPRNLDEADDFAGSGAAGRIRDGIKGTVDGTTERAAGPVADVTEAPPDPARGTPKPVTPQAPLTPGAPPPPTGAEQVVPPRRPAPATDLSAGPAEVDQQMAEAEITDQDLSNSNEPELEGALEQKRELAAHARTAPAQARADEAQLRDQTRAEQAPVETSARGEMGALRNAAFVATGARREATQTEDESRRAEVAKQLEQIHTQTKTEVEQILAGLDAKVATEFDAGEARARQRFEQYVDARMSAYKDRRYSGLTGKGRWLRDKFMGLPSEVNRFFDEGRRLYLAEMDRTIAAVADVVGTGLTDAKNRIAEGRRQVDEYVASLPRDLRQVGQEAADDMDARFGELEQSVDAKRDALVRDVAQRYQQANEAIDARIEQLQAENQGIVGRVVGAIGGAIRKILEIKEMLSSVLSTVASAVMAIIRDPGGFVSKLFGGIKQGFERFVGNIGPHLRRGLVAWLTGTMAAGGIQLPERWDLKGILSLVLQILGLVWSNVRRIIVTRIGEPVMARLESTVGFFQNIASGGLAAVWSFIVDKVGDIKEMVFGKIKEFLIERVIKAGIVWLISLLNPAGALFKVAKAIYDVVTFFVQRAAQIGQLLSSIYRSVRAVASGAFGSVAGFVEDALARSIPVAIGFLASLLGLGGIADKVKGIIEAIRKPINAAIGKVVDLALRFARPLISAMGRGAARVRSGVDRAKAWGRQQAGKAKAKLSAGAKRVREKLGIKTAEEQADLRASQMTEAEKDATLDAALAEAKPFAERSKDDIGLKAGLLHYQRKHKLRSLVRRGQGPQYELVAQLTPDEKKVDYKRAAGDADQSTGLRAGDKVLVLTAGDQWETADHAEYVDAVEMYGQPFARFRLTVKTRGAGMISIPVADSHRWRKKERQRREPHVMKLTIVVDGREVASETFVSGEMTKEQYELGWPESALATHTERKALRKYEEYLRPGAVWTMTGHYLACKRCKHHLRRAADSGATIVYQPGGF